MTEYSRVLVSYPKAGRTWLWYAVCKAVSHHYDIELQRGGSLKWLKNPLFEQAGIPLASSTHGFYSDGEEKITSADRLGLMTRDPRDLIVSSYFWKKTDDWDAHIEAEANKIGRWMQEWIESGMVFSLRLDYQDLHDSFEYTMRCVLDWLGATSIDSLDIRWAQSESRFETMHEEDSWKARKGESGDWRNHLTPEQESYIWETLEHYPCDIWERYRGIVSA